MKILLICSLFEPHKGGIETMVAELGFYLKARGHKVSILTKRYNPSLPEKQKINGLTVYRFPNPKNLSDYRQLGDFLNKHQTNLRADVVHVVGLRRPLPLLGWYLSTKWDAKLVGTICGGEIPLPKDHESFKVWKSGKHTVQPFVKSFSNLSACSMFLKKQFNAIGLLNSKKVVVIYAGIDCTKHNLVNTFAWPRRYILSLRRLVHSKGVDILIKAYAKYALSHKEDLLIAGDGPEKKKLKLLVKNLNLHKRVFFLGDVSLGISRKLLRGAFFTVVPSRSEGGGLVNIEAQALGCPVIASRSGGIREYLNHNSLYFENGNVSGLRSKMIQMAENEGLRLKLSKTGKDFALRFCWKELIKEYLSFYQKASKIRESGDFPKLTQKMLEYLE